MYASWISELGGWAVIFGCLYLIGYSVLWIIWTPRKRYIIHLQPGRGRTETRLARRMLDEPAVWPRDRQVG